MRKSLLLLLGLFLCAPYARGEEKRLSFANDVMPVFFKAGCNRERAMEVPEERMGLHFPCSASISGAIISG